MSSIIVVGAGPGLGASIASRFARGGFAVSLVDRRAGTLAEVHSSLTPYGVPVASYMADAGRADDLDKALAAAMHDRGVPDVVVYNAAVVRADGPGELSVEELAQTFNVNVSGALVAALATVPAMQARGSGAFLVTGGLPRPSPSHLSLSLGKAALRALVALLAEYYAPSGVHVATVVVAEEIRRDTGYDALLIAEEFWRLHRDPPGAWRTEHVFTSSA
ncbi:SDR family NAD(P)-dependent oxidoreductase [Marmoricola sp. URHB0036]|uniref:SDR family NAD(P)-dependent oxidoreductase n=1 Tax=Marmoricola sp. URHB0036 TaxID=1298863 RepID=UPI00041B4F3B|nr:SDR family NAD(P)-dependent oxidoreductase [Marmoricola sp. URHB0036]